MLRRQVVVPAGVLWVLFLLGTLFFKAHRGGLVAVVSNVSFVGLVTVTLLFIVAGMMAWRRRP